MYVISVYNDFSHFPTGRYKKSGKGSGEDFRDRILIPAIKQRGKVIVDLDGPDGYSSSFLEEAFGGLLRRGLTLQEVKSSVELRASTKWEAYKGLAERYIESAARANSA